MIINTYHSHLISRSSFSSSPLSLSTTPSIFRSSFPKILFSTVLANHHRCHHHKNQRDDQYGTRRLLIKSCQAKGTALLTQCNSMTDNAHAKNSQVLACDGAVIYCQLELILCATQVVNSIENLTADVMKIFFPRKHFSLV